MAVFDGKNRNILYSFGTLNPEEGHKTLLRALTITDPSITVLMFVNEGYYSIKEISDFARSLGVFSRIKIKPIRLFNSTLIENGDNMAVVLPSLSGSCSCFHTIDLFFYPLLVSSTALNRKLVVDGVNGLMHSPGNWHQLGKQINYLYKNPTILQYFIKAHGL